MILYSVTVNIEPDIEQEWLTYMKSKHIPQVLATGMFIEHKMFKLLNAESENQGITYSVQYFLESMDHLERYLDEFAPPLIEEHFLKYRDKHLTFRTVLEQV